MCRGTGNTACRGCMVFWKTTQKAHDRRCQEGGGEGGYLPRQPIDDGHDCSGYYIISGGENSSVLSMVENSRKDSCSGRCRDVD